jgi:hypothetical protein
MNFLKNLIIIMVLAAVGYGVYTSLSHNSESSQTASSAPGWPVAPTVEMPTAPTVGAALKGAAIPLAGSPLPPSNTAGLGVNSTVAPPFTNAAAPAAQGNAAGAVAGGGAASSPGAVPAMPYPSSTGPSVAMPASSNAPSVTMPPSATYPDQAPSVTPGVSVSPGNPIASAGAPVGTSVASQTTLSETVHNLAPPPEVSAALAAAGVPAAPHVDAIVLSKFNAFMSEVHKRLDEGKFAEALLALSSLYNDPNLPPLPAEQRNQLDGLIARLAGTVIYSRQHLLEKPYVVQSGDTLDKIAQQYRIPWQLLGRINGLLSPNGDVNDNESKDRLLPVSCEMKVVRGPFDAVVNLSRHELTLMLNGRYAGRFPIGVGRDQPSVEGVYTVRDKTPNPTYRGPDGVQYSPGDPRNPLGSAWIGLTDRIGIHGSSNPQGIGRDDNRGSICVCDQHVQDLYGILSVGSRVTIVR